MGCVDFGVVVIETVLKNPTSDVKIEVNKISKQVANSIMENLNEEQTNIISSQNQNINIQGSCCFPIKIEQNASVKVINTSKIDIKMVSDIADSFKKQTIDEVDKATNSLKNIAGEDIGTRLTFALKKSIENVSESSTFKKSIKEKISNTFINQGQNINIECSSIFPMPPPPPESGLSDSGCYISQSFVLEQVCTNIMETMMVDVVSNPDVDSLLAEISSKDIYIKSVKTGGFQREELSWWDTNKNIFIIILFVFLIPLLIKILFM